MELNTLPFLSAFSREDDDNQVYFLYGWLMLDDDDGYEIKCNLSNGASYDNLLQTLQMLFIKT